jgi:hypothetical protein
MALCHFQIESGVLVNFKWYSDDPCEDEYEKAGEDDYEDDYDEAYEDDWEDDYGEAGDTVILPEGVEIIGHKALKKFKCVRLVMPKSLKKIMNRAFACAKIEEIDFSRCQLESIEFQAFIGCEAKAALPDSVKHLGNEAVRALKLVKEGKLKLPGSLRSIGRKAIDLSAANVLEVDEVLVSQDSNLEDLISMTVDKLKRWLILNVLREGKLVCRVPFEINKGEAPKKNCYIRGQWFYGPNYDEWFEYEEDRRLRATVAAFRVMFPEGLTPERVNAYKKYAITNFPAMMADIEEDTEAITLYDNAGIITVYRLKQLLEKALRKNNTEVAAVVLDLLNRKSCSVVKSLDL